MRAHNGKRSNKVFTYRGKCSGTVAGLEPNTQLGKSPLLGWGWCCLMKRVAWTELSDSTASWRGEMTPWGAAESVETDGAGTPPCKADRNTAFLLFWSGKTPAARARGAASAWRTEIKVGYSHSPFRWPPLKSTNPREKISACFQTCCSARSELLVASACSCRDGGQRSGAEGAQPLLK